jgi:polyhydroxyalkanoate synthesis regulator phasin
VVARTKVARTRLTAEEHAQLEHAASEAGVSTSEYLRGLIVGHRAEVRDLRSKIESLDSRVQHLETQFAKKWAEEV